MIAEARRRAYLRAMRIDSWVACRALPHAAPSNPSLWAPIQVEENSEAPVSPAVADWVEPAAPTARVEIPRPQVRQNNAPVEVRKPEPKPVAPAADVPRFTQQLLRAGACLLLVELPTGETFQSRDPAYVLLRDLLRAAGLPDSPQLIGEPVRWPLLQGGSLDQGTEMAREFVQSFVAARREEQGGCACIWLVGASALRFAADLEPDAYAQDLNHELLGPVWTLPGLDRLLDEPSLKSQVWRSMRQVIRRWQSH